MLETKIARWGQFAVAPEGLTIIAAPRLGPVWLRRHLSRPFARRSPGERSRPEPHGPTSSVVSMKAAKNCTRLGKKCNFRGGARDCMSSTPT